MRTRELASHRRCLVGFRLRLQEALDTPAPPPEARVLIPEVRTSLAEYELLLDQAEAEHQARRRPIAPEAA